MAPANASSRQPPRGHTDRRLGAGVAVSVLLHALLLSLQFGMPGFDAGSGAPLSVVLALPPLPPASEPLPVPPVAQAPLPPVLAPAPVAPPAAPPIAVPPASGLRLVDPIAPEPAAALAAASKPARSKPPKRSRLVSLERRVPSVTTPVIAAEARPDSAFTVPLPEVDPPRERVLADAATEPEAGESPPAPAEAPLAASPTPAALAQETLEKEGAEASRLAAESEEIRRVQDGARMAAEERAGEARRSQQRLAQQQAEQQAQQQASEARLATHQRERQFAQQARLEQESARRQADDERQRLDSEAAAQRQHEQEALARHAEQRRTEESAAREAKLLERQRLEESQRRIAEQLAQREHEGAQRLAQEQAERERLEELARRRLAEERARRDADERAEAQQLAQQRAREAARQAAAAPARSDAALPGLDGQGGPGAAIGQGAGPGAGPGAGSGTGTSPGRPAAGALAGGVGSRARQLLRGVTIPSVEPPARVHQQADARRVVADGAERDAPLRLYVDSVRQKLERNAVLGGARFGSREVRIDPLVSLSLRSDGSIDEVTIVRSSGRPDMDDAVRRFVRLNARYSAFPPNVAARFDVIEIRRVWAFADGLKLMEELR